MGLLFSVKRLLGHSGEYDVIARRRRHGCSCPAHHLVISDMSDDTIATAMHSFIADNQLTATRTGNRGFLTRRHRLSILGMLTSMGSTHLSKLSALNHG